jgi:hypothetical protein
VHDEDRRSLGSICPRHVALPGAWLAERRARTYAVVPRPLAGSCAVVLHSPITPHNPLIHVLTSGVVSLPKSLLHPREHRSIRPPLSSATAVSSSLPRTLPPTQSQYVEPMWTKGEHRRAMASVIKLGTDNGVTGRGRCAAEGAKKSQFSKQIINHLGNLDMNLSSAHTLIHVQISIARIAPARRTLTCHVYVCAMCTHV